MSLSHSRTPKIGSVLVAAAALFMAVPIEAKPADTADEMDASAHSQASWNAAGILASLGEMG